MSRLQLPRLDAVEIVTFDCYGTLVDWEAGLRETLGQLAAEHGLATGADDLIAVWEPIQFAMLAGPYRRYREILRASVAETFRLCGVTLSADEAGRLGERIGHAPVFEDVPGALARLKERYRLAILSNIDDDLLAESVPRLGVEFDELVTAEQIRSYKPASGHFREAVRRFGRPPEAFLHTAFGIKYDRRPARELGMVTAWVARGGVISQSEDEEAADLTVATLAELADRLLNDD